jgi:hypothetical protein
VPSLRPEVDGPRQRRRWLFARGWFCYPPRGKATQPSQLRYLSPYKQWVSGGGVIWNWVSMVWSMSRVPVRDWLAKDHASTYTSPDFGELAPHLTRPFRIMSTDSIPPVFAMRFETNRSP